MREYKEEAELTTILECKLSPDGEHYARILVGAPYHSDNSPYGWYIENRPVYVETPSSREKLFAKSEMERQQWWLSANNIKGAPVALDYHVEPEYTCVACVGEKKDVLLFTGVVDGVDLRWHTSVAFSYNPYKKVLSAQKPRFGTARQHYILPRTKEKLWRAMKTLIINI